MSVKLNLPALRKNRQTFLREGLSNTVAFNALMGSIGRENLPQQLVALDYLLSIEVRRKGGPRRSIAKRLHGRINSVRGFLEWQKIEERIRAGT